MSHFLPALFLIVGVIATYYNVGNSKLDLGNIVAGKEAGQIVAEQN